MRLHNRWYMVMDAGSETVCKIRAVHRRISVMVLTRLEMALWYWGEPDGYR